MQVWLNTIQKLGSAKCLAVASCAILMGCTVNSKPERFSVHVDNRLIDGWYFVITSRDDLSPSYSILVKDGAVIADFSDDPYGCRLARGCEYHLDPNDFDYSFINQAQVMRITPDGRKVVLTWYEK